MTPSKVAVALSGGVDSAVTAMLLKEQGYSVVGITMTLGRDGEAESLSETRKVAETLGIELEVCDYSQMWNERVCKYIANTYLAGKTPNPCVRCNEMVKFSLLPRDAFASGCEYFATGHYARLVDGRLARAVDRTKDQSYFLYRVDSEILKRTIFPLGGYLKDEVREMAKSRGLPVASKSDSQDFCGGEVKNFIDCSPRIGNIVLKNGKVLGKHQGFWNYTIGKRKGLGVGGGVPFYVVELRPDKNEVVVAPKDEAVSFDLELVDVVGHIDKSLPVKVRSAGEPRFLKDGIIGVAPGQSAVFYDGEIIVGGGIIA